MGGESSGGGKKEGCVKVVTLGKGSTLERRFKSEKIAYPNLV